MTKRYRRKDIEQCIAMQDFSPTLEKLIRQLLADKDKLIAHIKAIEYCVFSHDSEFTGESLKALIEEMDK